MKPTQLKSKISNLKRHVLNSRHAIALAFGSTIFLAGGLVVAVDPPAIKPGVVAAAVPTSQPSADEIQTAIDAKQFSTAVKLATKMLAVKAPAGAGTDRFQVTMLKGYAQAGMKSNSTAVMTFKSAGKETKDTGQIALAKWTAELFRTAGSTSYTPKKVAVGAIKQGPYDLLNAEQRKDAFGALLEDNLAALEPKLKTAAVSQNLNQIWPVLQQVMDLDELDIVANGNDDKTNTLASALLDHSRNLLTSALKADWARVSDIDANANTTNTVATQVYINNTMVTQNETKKNGLSSSNMTELKNIISVCQKIHDAANAFMSQAKSDKDWNTILSDSDRVAARASDVLNAEYGSSVTSGTSTTYDQNGYNGTNTVGTPSGQYPNAINATNTTPVAPPKTSNATPTKPKGKTGP